MTTALTAAAPTPFALLSEPPPLPRPYSLLESASAPEIRLITDPRALAGGLTIWPYSSYTPSLWAPCNTGTFAQKDLTQFGDDFFEQEPFTVYQVDGCSSIDATRDELEARIRAVFLATESAAVEEQLAKGTVGDNPRYLSDSNVATIMAGAAQLPAAALAQLERYGATTGRRCVIHADPATVSMWSTSLIERDGVLRTIANDTLVVSGAGYAFATVAGHTAAQGEAWAFVTTPLTIARGDLQVLFSYDHSVNDGLAMAERNYAVGWDGTMQRAVLIDITP